MPHGSQHYSAAYVQSYFVYEFLVHSVRLWAFQIEHSTPPPPSHPPPPAHPTLFPTTQGPLTMLIAAYDKAPTRLQCACCCKQCIGPVARKFDNPALCIDAQVSFVLLHQL